MDHYQKIGILFAFAAACCAAMSPPMAKLVLGEATPMMTSSMLNLGCGIGLFLLFVLGRRTVLADSERHVRREDWKKLAAITVFDICASVSMMTGLTLTAASTASLLNNFETVATAVIAIVMLKEVVSKRTWTAILFITVGSIILSVDDFSTLALSPGALLVLAACVFWGFENNFMKTASDRNPIEVVMVKGFCAGAITMVLGLIFGEPLPPITLFLITICIGFIVYGMTNVFFMFSQRRLGSARAATFYGINTFLAALISCIIFAETPGIAFLISTILMVIGLYFASEKEEKGTV